jgi:hypothetical protein
MEDFVTYELAVKLREKGFREDCIAYYHTDGELIYNRDEWRGGDYKSLLNSYNSLPKNPVGCEQIDSPTITQVLKWLREKKKIHIQILANACGYIHIICDTPEKGASDIHDSDYFGPNEGGAWDEYEDCAIAGIEYVLDNLI